MYEWKIYYANGDIDYIVMDKQGIANMIMYDNLVLRVEKI